MNVGDDGRESAKPLILIVDDIAKNLQVLGNMLNRQGEYRISIATDGKQALTMLDKVSPDLILLDVVMPELDGFEVCRRLKGSLKTKEIPVIFLTAKTETEDIVNGFEIGAVDYVTKPFNSAELLARVRTHLELKKAKDEQKKLIAELQSALARVKQLSGMLPICSHCKKIRDDAGYWQQVEDYIQTHSHAEFSHGICPQCLRKYYPEFAEQIIQKMDEKRG